MRLPAEWERQSFVELTFPHKETDWCPILPEVLDCYYHIISTISCYEPVVVMAADMSLAQSILCDISNVRIIGCKSNDTWTRDHGFITCEEDGKFFYKDFQFNGWGLKFASNYDNQLNRVLWESGILDGTYENHLDFVLEGGSIESDGCGTLLTTSSCLLAPNRNSVLSRIEIENRLMNYFGVSRVLWLNSGKLEGDDTDGHIDTLARFCPNDTIVYVKCEDRLDIHFQELENMETELSSFKTIEGNPYRLIGLPHPTAIYDSTGERLPATYANYLVINGAVLYPTYNQAENDAKAKIQLSKAYPDRDIIGIDCCSLIKQHGSLHCCTMQYIESRGSRVESRGLRVES